MEELYSWYIHFNPYIGQDGIWNAVKRSQSVEYLNGTLDANDIIKHKDVMVLIKYIKDLK